MTMQGFLPVAAAMVAFLPLLDAYPYGPPLTVCESMFPLGHGVDAQTGPPPYELLVSNTQITEGSTITVTLRVKDGFGHEYFEGIFVQAREASCDSVAPVGYFSIPQNDFLRLLSCGGVASSAVSHGSSSRQTEQTFVWHVPSRLPHPRIYFQATVVKHTTVFWTNVFSEYVVDPFRPSPRPSSHCNVMSKVTVHTENAASPTRAMTSLVFVAVFFTNDLL